MYQVNFHCHSTASDGAFSPAAVVSAAKENGISYLAITDHDTLAGQAEAVEAAARCGISYVPGLELSASEHRYLHIVGLGVSLKPSPLTALCKELRDGRDRRNQKILGYLADRGIQLSFEEVAREAGGTDKSIGRPHFARVMVRKGYVSSADEAFRLYFTSKDYEALERRKPSAGECIDAIHAAGGIAVLAHPIQLGYDDSMLYALTESLCRKGLDGIECYYPTHPADKIAWYLRIAENLGLFVSAGTDFHGGGIHPGQELTPYPLRTIERIPLIY